MACAGSSLVRGICSSWGEWGPVSGWGTQGSLGGSFSCWGAWAPVHLDLSSCGVWAQYLGLPGMDFSSCGARA